MTSKQLGNKPTAIAAIAGAIFATATMHTPAQTINPPINLKAGGNVSFPTLGSATLDISWTKSPLDGTTPEGYFTTYGYQQPFVVQHAGAAEKCTLTNLAPNKAYSCYVASYNLTNLHLSGWSTNLAFKAPTLVPNVNGTGVEPKFEGNPNGKTFRLHCPLPNRQRIYSLSVYTAPSMSQNLGDWKLEDYFVNPYDNTRSTVQFEVIYPTPTPGNNKFYRILTGLQSNLVESVTVTPAPLGKVEHPNFQIVP